MKLNEKQSKLAEKFIAETLSESEALEFRTEFENNKAFADHVTQMGYISAAIEAMVETSSIKRKSVPFKKIIRISGIAACILVFISMGISIVKLSNKPPLIQKVVEQINDTIYIRQNDIINYPKKIAKPQYAQSMQMDKLVAENRVNILTRSENISDYCLPHNNQSFKVGEQVNFELTKFRTNNYKLHLLAFYKHIEAVDTLAIKTGILTEEEKQIFSWIPKIKGIYYWEVYMGNDADPLVIRRINVK